MSAHATQSNVCRHPGRDVAIVALSAVVVALVAVVVVMAVDGGPLAVLGAGGTSLAAAFTVGMGVLQHLKSSN
ncbi:hypothetical protein ACFV9D_05325 [Streptomyces sp. NPDC059875]|uniref:hypothetical protein n=1 Tax=unclassified Streptomyces TaxID=2593676 RepID=UPI00365219BB